MNNQSYYKIHIKIKNNKHLKNINFNTEDVDKINYMNNINGNGLFYVLF